MVPSKPLSNPLALAVLVLLFERPMHPYEMAATLKIRNMEKSFKLRYGSLYTVIEALQQQALIAVRETVREGRRPERTIYELTPSGAERMRSWLRELLGTPVKEYPQFEAALSLLPAVPPDEAVALLEARLVRLGETAEELRSTVEAVAKLVERLFVVEIDYRLALIDAERQFIEGFIRRVKEDADYVRAWKAFHSGPAGETCTYLQAKPAPGAVRFDPAGGRSLDVRFPRKGRDGGRRGSDRFHSRSRRGTAHETQSP